MKLLVFTAAFYDRDYEQKQEKLLATAGRFNIDVVPYGKGEFFSFFNSKIIDMGVFLNNHKADYTHALYVDCADTLFLASTAEILAKYVGLGSPPVLVSGEKGCHPFPEMVDKFSVVGGPWRFMNPGLYIGEIPKVMEVLSRASAFGQLKTNDQGHWYKAWDEHNLDIQVDTDCLLFQTMSECEFDREFMLTDGRLYNTVTKTYPCVVHFNGGKDDQYVALQQKIFEYSMKGVPYEAFQC